MSYSPRERQRLVRVLRYCGYKRDVMVFGNMNAAKKRNRENTWQASSARTSW